MSFLNVYYGKQEIINDGYVSSQLYKCLWIREFSGFFSEPIVV